nr:HAMP domain-containing histidine kinase [Lachnospiraceae bacterium]
LVMALFLFVASIIALFLYISKDVYYYNVLNYYFRLPKSVWQFMMFNSFPRQIAIRLLNLFTLLFLYFCERFSANYLVEFKPAGSKSIQNVLTVFILLQLLFYDPFVQEKLYLCLAESGVSGAAISRILEGVTLSTRLLNAGILVASVVHLFLVNRHTYAANFFRGYALGESVCFAAIVLAFEFVFWFAPMPLVKVSSLAGYVSYRSIPLVDISPFFYSMYPYYLIVAGGTVLYFMLSYQRVQKKLTDKDLEIGRVISASDTTSKAFCHYMKNEILAMESEIRMLAVQEESLQEREELIKKMEHLYHRLDEIHRSTKMTELTLKVENPAEMMDEILEHMKGSLAGVEVIREYSTSVPDVMADADRFEQAVHNILTNALDAMAKAGKEQKELRIHIRSIDNWVQISITDNGTGISKTNIAKIFNPFFSSQPIKEHWGVGLTLTYKILQVHGGKIEVVSDMGKGTTFNILLPTVKMLENEMHKEGNKQETAYDREGNHQGTDRR